MIGGSVGSVAHTLWPHVTANPGAYALVGMGAAFAGIVRTPLTSVIMIFEMTRDYSIIVPLMIANLISFFISQRLQRAPIYEALALQEGVFLPTAESREELAGIRVGQIMHTSPELFPADLDLGTANKLMTEMGRNAWLVGDLKRLEGMVTAREIDESRSQVRPAARCSRARRFVSRMCTRIIRCPWRWKEWARRRWMPCRWSAAPISARYSASSPCPISWPRTACIGGT